MVQEFRPMKTHAGYLSETLGPSLGQGLSDFMGNYFANKAVEGVINDPSLKDAPLSERQSRLQMALQPHGERGQQIFQNRLGIEQKAQQEQQQKQLIKQQGILGRVMRGEQVSNQELEMLPAEVQIAAKKAMTPKNPPGGLSGQPVPQEVSQMIPQILNANKNATADDLAVAFDEAKIPRAFSNSYIENRRRQDESKAKGEGTQIQIHDLSKDLAKEIGKDAKTAKTQIRAIDEIENALNSNEIGPYSPYTLSEKIPFLQRAFLTPNIQKFLTASKSLFEGMKDMFGIRLSDADLAIVQDMLPDPKKSVEANREAVKFMKIGAEMKLAKENISRDIIKENGGYRPLDFEIKINDKLDELFGDKIDQSYQKLVSSNPQVKSPKKQEQSQERPGFVKMKDPQGKERWIPENVAKQIQEAQNAQGIR